MIENMAVVTISETDLARDVHAVLEKVRNGAEIVSEQDHRPIAVMKKPNGPARMISESIAIAKRRENERGFYEKQNQAGVELRRGKWKDNQENDRRKMN